MKLYRCGYFAVYSSLRSQTRVCAPFESDRSVLPRIRNNSKYFTYPAMLDTDTLAATAMERCGVPCKRVTDAKKTASSLVDTINTFAKA